MKTIHYTVDTADWLGKPSKQIDSDPKSLFYGLPFMVPSKKIDDRTIRSRSFKIEKLALRFAKKFLKEHDDEWLAYVKIKKHTIIEIKTLK